MTSAVPGARCTARELTWVGRDLVTGPLGPVGSGGSPPSGGVQIASTTAQNRTFRVFAAMSSGLVVAWWGSTCGGILFGSAGLPAERGGVLLWRKALRGSGRGERRKALVFALASAACKHAITRGKAVAVDT